MPTVAPSSGRASTGSDPPSGVRARVVATAAAPSGDARELPDLLAFVEHEAPEAKTIAHRFRVSLAEAEEIRQDTLIAMVTSEEPIRSPLAWFWSAAELRRRRLVGRAVREQRHRPAVHMLAEHQRAPFPSPDAGLKQQALDAVIEHVKPSRRSVAALRLSGYSETEVAAELNLPVGSVRSKWARARKDGESYWAALLALLTALCLRLVGRGRRGGAAFGAQLPGAVPLLACAALPLAISGDAVRGLPLVSAPAGEEASVVAPAPESLALGPLLERETPGEEAGSAFDSTDQSSPGEAGREDTRAARVHPAAAAPVRAERAWTAMWQRTPGAGSVLDSIAGGDASGQHAPGAGSGSVPTAPEAPPRTQDVASDPSRAAPPAAADRIENARSLLLTAAQALAENDRRKVRDVLELYELTYPEDPVPAQYSDLAAALRAP